MNLKKNLSKLLIHTTLKNWIKGINDEYDFMTLSREWIQMGSDTVKMIAAAGKYAVTRNQKKKIITFKSLWPKIKAPEF